MHLLTIPELCELLHLAPQTVYNRLARAPESLPPRLILPGTRKVLWRREAVEQWLAVHEQPATVPLPAPRGRGRLCKVEEIARRRQGRAGEKDHEDH